MQQVVTSGGATTTTKYIGTYEDVATTGGTTVTTKYYQMGSVGTAESVNGTFFYQVADTLGSVSATLTASGGVQATELYDPFGSVRYSNGAMPTSYGYTQMRQDPSGLNYDHARYYDASVGQFVTADSVQGTNRYAYVGGNPETQTDPTGHCFVLCAVIGAAIGAVVGVVYTVVKAHIDNKPVTWGDVGKNALSGALIGGAIGLTGGAALALTTSAASATVAGGALTTGAVALQTAAISIIGGATTGGSIGGAFGFVSSNGDIGASLKGALYGFVGGAYGGAIGGLDVMAGLPLATGFFSNAVNYLTNRALSWSLTGNGGGSWGGLIASSLTGMAFGGIAGRLHNPSLDVLTRIGLFGNICDNVSQAGGDMLKGGDSMLQPKDNGPIYRGRGVRLF